MSGRIQSLSLTSDSYKPAANAQMVSQAPSSASSPLAIQKTEDSSYGTQVELLTRLQDVLKRGATFYQVAEVFSRLDPDVQFRGYQLLCPDSQDQKETIQKGFNVLLRNPAIFLRNIEKLLLYVKNRALPSLEETSEAVTVCLGRILPRGISSFIAKYAMERFDDEMFGPQQWMRCWGATPVTFTKTLPELRELVNQRVISGAKTEKPAEQMNEVECANFLEGIAVCRDEISEPTEEVYECLNRRMRPEDKLLAGFTCAVTYIPEYVRKDNKIFSVTARTLALDLGPNPTREGMAARLFDPDYVFNTVLTPEDANRTEAPFYFVMERDVAPDTKGKKPSVLIDEITSQGDKGWQLAEPRNFFATVFSRCAWKGLFLYGRQPVTYTYGQGKSRSGQFLVFGGFAGRGLYVADVIDRDRAYNGAGGSRKGRAWTM